ncbi:MAG: 50S ribosomal protein L25 [Bacteroidota bacterium]
MDTITLDAQARETGTKHARAIRRTGHVPCVLYGHGEEPFSFQVDERRLTQIAFTDTVNRIEVQVDGSTWTCVLKDLAFHPITDRIIHADFQVLKDGEKVKIAVPVHFEGKAAGEVQGGMLQRVSHKLRVSATAEFLPSHVTIDVSPLMVGDSVQVRDLSLEGVTFEDSASQVVAKVVGKRAEPLDDEEAEGDAAEGTEEATDEG